MGIALPSKKTDSERSLAESLLPAPAVADFGFDARFVEDATYERAEGVIRIRFFYIPNGDVDLLATYLTHKLPHFCLPRSEVVDALAKCNPGDVGPLVQLIEKAKGLLITAMDEQPKSGELGELILFLFLELALKAPRIACKMILKTSANMPVHGSDAIHARMVGDRLKVIWGESKMYKSSASAFAALRKSVLAFLTPAPETGKAPRNRDIEIVQENIEVEDDNKRERLLEYFNPYTKASNRLDEGFGCLVAFDTVAYGDRSTPASAWIAENGETLVDQLCTELTTLGKSTYDFEVILLPVPSVEALRTLFF